MICAKHVFRCFRSLERAGDALTGAAGPVFVLLAVVLLSIGAFCFFEVIAPSLPWPWLTTPICVLIAINLFTHYYWVCTISPGFVSDPPPHRGTSILWAKRREFPVNRALTGVRWSDNLHITKATLTKCRRCGEPRPERAHHCRICNRCVLKYDHHCPVVYAFQLLSVFLASNLFLAGINQCVGLYNERHFILFLIYMSASTLCYSVLGWPHVWAALGWYDEPWRHLSPEVAFLLTYILAAVIFLAVTVMTSYHIWGIAQAETSVESQDNEQYRKIAKGRGEDFVNSFDLGKRKNLELFFNIGIDGYPTYTLFVPLRVEPHTDGRSWPRRPGLDRHYGVRAGEELTDEEDD